MTSKWATVTATSPLAIQVDGDTSALPFTPDTLVTPLAVDDRVLCEIANNRVVIHGRAGGIAAASTSQAGVVELATDAETQAGTDTGRAVTPAGLASVFGTGSLSLASGFTAVSTYTPKLARVGNVVTVEFVLTSASTVPTGTVSAGTGTQIATIPAGFRPVNPLVGLIGFNNSGAVAIKYTVDSSGNVKAYPDSSLGSTATLYCTGQFFAA